MNTTTQCGKPIHRKVRISVIGNVFPEDQVSRASCQILKATDSSHNRYKKKDCLYQTALL